MLAEWQGNVRPRHQVNSRRDWRHRSNRSNRRQNASFEALHKAQAKQAESVVECQRRLAAEALHKAQAEKAESVSELQRRLAAEVLHKA